MGNFTPLHRGGSGPPLLLVHGFTDTWRTWELILPELERHHDVLAVTLAGHAGGPPLTGPIDDTLLVDELERAMDVAGFATADIVGNSLGGYLALHLAMRDRARSVVALAPAGGWADGDPSFLDTLNYFVEMQELLRFAAPRAEAILATPEGRRRATQFTTVNYEHIPVELLAHQMRGAAACPAAMPLTDYAREHGWRLDPERLACPVRCLCRSEDRLLLWPQAASRYRTDWLPAADWVELDGVGHAPQLDVPLETSQLILGFTNQ
jgi:pimeloyl-ACP methyl ester carboxylesterase